MNYIIRPLNDFGWWITNEFLNVTSSVMQTVNPHLPDWILQLTSLGLLKLSDLVNHRWLLDPLMSVATHAIIPFVGEHYDGDEEREDTEVFFRLGINRYRSNYGTGDTNEPENCFFPNSLTDGPLLVHDHTSPMTERRNKEIASSCALLSLLSYRHDDDIIDCMRGADPNMLPDVWFFSVHTGEESDLAVFVADDQSWAAFCFRGTEPETLRDWATSALLTDPVTFSTGMPHPNHPELMRCAKVRGRYYRQLKGVYNEKLVFHTGAFNPIAPDHEVTAFELAVYLHRRDCKVYYTGHSLGAGIATVMAADVFASTGLLAAGVISFGSPPVGDTDFCTWFNENFMNYDDPQTPRTPAVSWRFVNGDEFAPMAPPLPFTHPEERGQFRHVGGLILVEHLLQADPEERSQEQMVVSLNNLSGQHNLTKIFMDHNLATTLRALRASLQ